MLPSASRGVFQLAGDFVPAADDRGGGAAASKGRADASGKSSSNPQRSSSSKRLAKSASSMNWPSRIAKVELPQGRDFDERCRQAMLAAVRIAQARDAEAEPLLRSLADSAAKRSPDAEAAERWPEYLAASRQRTAGAAHRGAGDP